jgi:hypothetical protein
MWLKPGVKPTIGAVPDKKYIPNSQKLEFYTHEKYHQTKKHEVLPHTGQ